jgi:hypothetical protein
MIRNHIESVYTHLEGIEEDHQVQLKNELDQVHNEFQTQLAIIWSENDAKINDLMKEIRVLKRSFEAETTVDIFNLNLHDSFSSSFEIFYT